MPTLRQFRYLVAIADTLNFRRAAEICHVSQPALSDQIRQLEERLKVQLLERSRRKVIVTPVGREVVDRARRVLRDVQDIIDLADHGRHVLQGTLRLGVLHSLGPYLLPPILPYLHQRYPQLTLYLREDTADNLLRRLEEGDLDLLLFHTSVHHAGLFVEPLFQEPLRLVVARDHMFADRPMLERADLRGLTILTLDSEHSLHSQVLNLCNEFGAKPLLDFATTSLDTLRQMAAMGVGAAFLPALYIRSEVGDDPSLCVLKLSPSEPQRQIGLVWRLQSARQSEYLALAIHIRDAIAGDLTDVPVVIIDK
jgi:LysR family hydrogen peroxide-inducible transcriptional activator